MTENHTSIRDQVRQVLLQKIGSGELRPGDRVVESKLAEEVGASSIPVREAIRELVAMDVLEFAPHRGAWVREVSFAETIEALEVRAALDRLAAGAAAANLRGRCRQLRATAKRITAAAEKRDFVAFQEHNQVFHRTVIEASGNRALLRVWESLAFEVRTRVMMDFLTSVDPVRLAKEHEAIVDALDHGDAKKAAARLASHANSLVRYLRRQMAAGEK